MFIVGWCEAHFRVHLHVVSVFQEPIAMRREDWQLLHAIVLTTRHGVMLSFSDRPDETEKNLLLLRSLWISQCLGRKFWYRF